MTIPKLPSYGLPSPSSLPQNKVDWRLDPTRAVLLIHDMQAYFVSFYDQESPLIKRLIENIAAVRAWCKTQRVPVLYTVQPIEQHPKDRALLNDMWGPGLMAADPALQHVVGALTPSDDDIVLTKWRYSAFQRSDLEDRMRLWGRDQLLICGVYAHIGCLTTAVDAFMRDIQPFMIGDAVADFSEEEHRWALRYVATRCGRVLSTSNIPQSAGMPISWDWLREKLLGLIDETERPYFHPDANLADLGLDSIRVMAMVAEWKQYGIEVKFEDLARHPSLNGWWSLIERQCQPAAVVSDAHAG